jgi:hypothetical protein
MYDFKSETLKSYIYLNGIEYTSALYVVSFWFYITKTGNYTLLDILNNNYQITINQNIISGSNASFTYNLESKSYNMIALVFETNMLTKIIINETTIIIPTISQIKVTNNTINFAFGNNNSLTNKFIGYLGNIKILSAISFINSTFDIDTLHSLMGYKKVPATTTEQTTTTTEQTTTTTEQTTTTTDQTTTTQPITSGATTTEQTTTSQPTTYGATTTTYGATTTTYGATTTTYGATTTTEPTTSQPTTTTTKYVTTTTNPPLSKDKAYLLFIS